MPGAGEAFASGVPVLPDEGGSGEAEEDWLSRNINQAAWWVVVDTCVDPRPGAFAGRLTGLAVALLDTSFAIRSRAAWPSFYHLADCAWCRPEQEEEEEQVEEEEQADPL